MNKKNFVFIGDSLTFGYGVNKNKNWVSKFSYKEHDFNVFNKGVNGNTTTDMLFRFSNDVTNNSPSYVFIMGGTNDLLSNKSVSSIIDNISVMIKESLTICQNIIIGIPPTIIAEDAYNLFYKTDTYSYCEKELYNLRNELIKLCNTYNLKFVDYYTCTLNNLNNNIFIDGIHLNEYGQEILLNEFIKAL